MANENEVEVGFGANLDGLSSGFADAASKVKEGAKSLASSMGLGVTAAVALGTAFERLGEKMLEAVKEALKESITGFGELGDAIEHLQHRIGGSAQDLSVLKVGLESVGLSTQTYEMIARRLPQVLLMHADAFKAAGVAYADSEGKLLPMQEVIANLNAHLEKFTAGSARNVEGVNLMGRAFFMMADMVELTKARMDEAQGVAEQFGEVLSDKDLQATNEFRRQTELLWIALKGFGLEIGRAVEPMLTELASYIRASAVPAFEAFKTVVIAFAALIEGFALGVHILWIGFVDLAAAAVLVAKVLNAILTLDVKGAEAAWGDFTTVTKAGMDEIVAHAEGTNKRMRALLNGPGKAPAEPHPADPNAGMVTPAGLAIVEAQSKRMLDIAKEGIRERGELNENWHKLELESDGAYWDKKIKLEQEGFDAQIASLRNSLAVTRKAAEHDQPGSENQKTAKAKEITLIGQIEVAEKQRADAYVNGQREMAAAREAKTNGELIAEFESAKKIQLAQVDAQAVALARKKDLYLVSDAEEIKASEELELQKFSIQRAALVKQQALYDNTKDAYKKLQFEIAALDAETAKKREELTTKSIEQQGIQWKKLFDSMDSGFQGTITKFLKGTASLGATIKGLYTDVVDAIIGEIARMAAAWMTQQIAMMLFGKTTAIGTIQTEAAKAGAGGVASMAAAPWPIDMGAPAFGAAMFAASSAYTAGIPGFAVGAWNVPHDMFTKIHAGETVLNPSDASKFRGALDGGRGGGDTNVHIHATDAASVERLLTQNGSAVMASLRRQLRGFNGRSSF